MVLLYCSYGKFDLHVDVAYNFYLHRYVINISRDRLVQASFIRDGFE
jgi:hypothetical protein